MGPPIANERYSLAVESSLQPHIPFPIDIFEYCPPSVGVMNENIKFMSYIPRTCIYENCNIFPALYMGLDIMIRSLIVDVCTLMQARLDLFAGYFQPMGLFMKS